MRRDTRFRGFDEAFSWLASNTNYETMATQRYDARTYGLGRVERLLRAMGRPDRAFDVAQVLGSKGKGSTATALAEILRASGRRVGLYTSPHLIDPRERIRIDGALAPDRLVANAIASLVPHAKAASARGEPLTFFELHTVAALLVFREARCDAAVLEAGMGGRLDATTAARAVVKVLTSISLDHVQHLGRTRAAIAFEKASAARRGVPLVSAEPERTSAGRVIAATCRRAGAPLVVVGRDVRVGDVRTAFDASSGVSRTTFVLRPPLGSDPTPPGSDPKRRGSDPTGSNWGLTPELRRLARAWRGQTPVSGLRSDERGQTPARRGLTPSSGGLTPLGFEVPMLGRHQATNAALAAVASLTARWRGPAVTVDHVRDGLARTTLRARLETLSLRPLVLVDGAHNPASLGRLAQTIRDCVPNRPRVFLVGMSADKDVPGSLRRLVGVANLVVATTSGQPRAADPAQLAATARALGHRAVAAPDLARGLEIARRRAGRKGVVVVTGSLYLCGACLRLWR